MNAKRITKPTRIKILLGFIILLLLGITIGSYLYLNRPQQKTVAALPPTVKDKKINQEDVLKITESQRALITLYLDKTNTKDVQIVSYYALAPLGILDPIAKPESFEDPSATINYLYGINGKSFGQTPKQLLADVEFPFKHATDFNPTKYYTVNQKKLEALVKDVKDDKTLTIIGSWDENAIYRINDAFGDTRRNIYWNITPDTAGYTYTIVKDEDTKEITKRKAEKTKYKTILSTMSSNGIQTIYKCDDVIIMIMFAVSDNAFGYTYNTKEKNSVDCGVLKNRYTVLLDKEIAQNWRYWVVD